MVLASVLAVSLVVSPEGALTPLRSVALVAPKYPMLAVVLACGALGLLASRRAQRARVTAFDACALGGLLVGLVAAVGNATPGLYVWPWLALQLAALAMVALSSKAAGQRRELLVDGLVLIAAVVAALAIYEAAGGALPWESARRPGATFGNRNAVGGFCAIALPLAVVRALAKPGAWRPLLVTLLVLAVLLCRARSSWVGLGVGGLAVVGAVAWWRGRGGVAWTAAPLMAGARRVGLALAVALLLLNLAPWSGLRWTEPAPVLASLSRLFAYDSGTGRSRVEQHQVGLSMLATRPLLGFGPGSWRREAPRFAHAAPAQHAGFIAPLWTPASDVLRHAVETGLLGVLAAGAMVVTLLGGALLRRARPPEPLTLALGSSLVVAVTISLFDASLYRPQSLLLVAAVAGALRDEGPRWRWAVPGWATRAALAGCAAVCVVVYFPRYQALRVLAKNFSPATVVALGEGRLLPYEAQLALATHAEAKDCGGSRQAAALLEAYLPYELESLRILARCAGQEGRRAEELRLLRRLLDVEPHDAAARARLAELEGQPAP
jgi:O-antigen ligase